MTNKKGKIGEVAQFCLIGAKRSNWRGSFKTDTEENDFFCRIILRDSQRIKW